MADSHKAKERGHADQDGDSVVITSHESLGHRQVCFCLNQSQSFLSIARGLASLHIEKQAFASSAVQIR